MKFPSLHPWCFFGHNKVGGLHQWFSTTSLWVWKKWRVWQLLVLEKLQQNCVVECIYGLHIGIIQGLCRDCIYAPRSQIWFIFTPKFGGRFPFWRLFFRGWFNHQLENNEGCWHWRFYTFQRQCSGESFWMFFFCLAGLNLCPSITIMKLVGSAAAFLGQPPRIFHPKLRKTKSRLTAKV